MRGNVSLVTFLPMIERLKKVWTRVQDDNNNNNKTFVRVDGGYNGNTIFQSRKREGLRFQPRRKRRRSSPDRVVPLLLIAFITAAPHQTFHLKSGRKRTCASTVSTVHLLRTHRIHRHSNCVLEFLPLLLAEDVAAAREPVYPGHARGLRAAALIRPPINVTRLLSNRSISGECEYLYRLTARVAK